MARQGRGDSESLSEGAGRRPNAHELGAYSQFVIEQHDLPKLYRKDNRDDFFHWMAKKDGFHWGNFLRLTSIKRMYKPYYENPWLWRNGKFHIFDAILHLHVIIALVLLSQLIVIVAGTSLEYDWRTNIWEAMLSSSNTIAWRIGGLFLLDGGTAITSDKKAYHRWIKRKNVQRVKTCIWDRKDEGHEVGWKQSFSHLAGLIETGVTEFPDLEGIDSKQTNSITKEHKYDLAVLRTTALWNNISKAEAYAEWQSLDEEGREAAEKEDKRLTTALKRYMEEEVLADLEQSLAKVMSEEDSEDYLPTLVDVCDGESRPLFWLTRGVTLKEGNADRGAESGFLEWVEEVSRGSGVNYLVSAAAMGKTTTLNLLTIHHLRTDVSGIWPIRVKLRRFPSMSENANLNLKDRIRADYVAKSDALHYETIGARFDLAIKGGDSDDRPLVILDGLDELTQIQQAELIDELDHYQGGIPIIIATRPISEVLEKKHAFLGKMTGQQRTEILRNLTLDPDELARVERLLPTSLIDRPFALLIAARVLKESKASVDHSDVNLSLSKICEIYEDEYFEREKKRTSDNNLKDLRWSVPQLKKTLRDLTLEQLRGNPNPPVSKETMNMLGFAEDLNIIDNKDKLIDTWLEGYYASKNDSLVREDWDRILENLSSKPDQSELIVRHFVASTPAEHTPNWDALGLDAPVVMDIASDEWLAMNHSSRKSMMERFGIPHDDQGRLDFPPDHDFMECELTELLALLHFHCWIADTERWHSPEEVVDIQWEQLFTALTMRYYEEFKDEINRLEKEVIRPPPKTRHEKSSTASIEWNKNKDSYYGREFALGRSLDAYRRQKSAFMEDLFGEGYARGVSRVRKLVPYNHHRGTRRDILDHDVMYFGDAAPSPLLRVIERGLGRSIGELQSLIFAVGMIEIHAERPLFKLSRVVLEKFVPSAYEIQGEPWNKARIMLHRIIGYRKNHSSWHIRNCKGMKFAESGFGIPLEITWDADYSSYARRFLSDEEFSPLKRIKNQKGNSTYVNDELRTKKLWNRHKRADSGVGVLISKNILSTLIIPDRDLDEKKTKQLESLSKIRQGADDWLEELKEPNAEMSDKEVHKSMLIAKKKIQLSQGMMERMEEELELHRNGEDLRLLSMKNLSQFLPSREEQTTVLLSMGRLIPWYVRDSKVLKEKIDEWWQDSLHIYEAKLPSEDPRLMRAIEVNERDFIVPRLKLQWDTPPPDFPYLVCFRGGGFAVDTEPVANVVSLRFSKGLLYWMIGREGRTRGSCVYRQPNTDFAEAYRDFMRIDNRRFQPLSVFEDIAEKLADLRATGKVAVYLKRGTINAKSQAQRVLLVPETDWQNRDFTDLTYDIRHQGKPGPPRNRGEIEEAFSSIYSVIPEAPEDAHLNRWYAVDFVLGSDDSGERHLFPDHETIEPLCQLCAAKTIDIEGDPKKGFICEGCSEWYHIKPNNEEE